MKTRKILRVLVPVGIVLTAIFILGGCASKKNIWGNTEKGLILSYRMPEVQSLKYVTQADVTQQMEVMGQKFEITMKSYQVYSINTDDQGKDQMTLGITIDTMFLDLKTPMKEFAPDMGSVIGQQFDIKFSKLGIESDFSQAEAITYDMAGETRNLGPEVQGFFPNFPDNPVKPGDSWTYQDTVREESEGNWLHIFSHCTATLAGYEEIAGKQCAKITIVQTGTILGEGNMQGLKTKSVGEVSGTETFYFAYKEGILVKLSSSGVAITETKTSGARELTIPSTREIVKEVWLKN